MLRWQPWQVSGRHIWTTLWRALLRARSQYTELRHRRRLRREVLAICLNLPGSFFLKLLLLLQLHDRLSIALGLRQLTLAGNRNSSSGCCIVNGPGVLALIELFNVSAVAGDLILSLLFFCSLCFLPFSVMRFESLLFCVVGYQSVYLVLELLFILLFISVAFALLTFFLCCTAFGSLQAHATSFGSESSLPQKPLDDALHLCVGDYLGHRHLGSLAHRAQAARVIYYFLVFNGVKALYNLELDAPKAARQLATRRQRGLVHQPVTKLT